jgi:hypothetical protein
MITQKEIKWRSAPRTGERWEFSNGVIATIGEISDPLWGTPEIAYTDVDDVNTAFKYNATTDPMPVRKL